MSSEKLLDGLGTNAPALFLGTALQGEPSSLTTVIGLGCLTIAREIRRASDGLSDLHKEQKREVEELKRILGVVRGLS